MQGGGGHSGSMQIEKGIGYRKVAGVGSSEHEGGEEGISVAGSPVLLTGTHTGGSRQPCASDCPPITWGTAQC